HSRASIAGRATSGAPERPASASRPRPGRRPGARPGPTRGGGLARQRGAGGRSWLFPLVHVLALLRRWGAHSVLVGGRAIHATSDDLAGPSVDRGAFLTSRLGTKQALLDRHQRAASATLSGWDNQQERRGMFLPCGAGP